MGAVSRIDENGVIWRVGMGFVALQHQMLIRGITTPGDGLRQLAVSHGGVNGRSENDEKRWVMPSDSRREGEIGRGPLVWKIPLPGYT